MSKVLARAGKVASPWGHHESRVVLEFEPRDLRIGPVWYRDDGMNWLTIVISLLPGLRMQLTFRTRPRCDKCEHRFSYHGQSLRYAYAAHQSTCPGDPEEASHASAD